VRGKGLGGCLGESGKGGERFGIMVFRLPTSRPQPCDALLIFAYFVGFIAAQIV